MAALFSSNNEGVVFQSHVEWALEVSSPTPTKQDFLPNMHRIAALQDNLYANQVQLCSAGCIPGKCTIFLSWYCYPDKTEF